MKFSNIRESGALVSISVQSCVFTIASALAFSREARRQNPSRRASARRAAAGAGPDEPGKGLGCAGRVAAGCQ